MKKLIELDAAVSALDDLPMDYGRWDVDDVLHALASVPTVDAAPIRHGRWINGKCDKCGGHAPFWSMATTYYPSKFCPHCGARMDGKDGDNHD